MKRKPPTGLRMPSGVYLRRVKCGRVILAGAPRQGSLSMRCWGRWREAVAEFARVRCATVRPFRPQMARMFADVGKDAKPQAVVVRTGLITIRVSMFVTVVPGTYN